MSLDWNLIVAVLFFGGLGLCLFKVLRVLIRWVRSRVSPEDQRISLREVWSEAGAWTIPLAFLLVILGNIIGHDLYRQFFIDQPVAYKEVNKRFEMHHRGTYLGSKDRVDFYLWGPRDSEDDFDDWQAVAEMKIQQSDITSCLGQLARAASYHSYDRVVLFPDKNKAFVVDSEERKFDLAGY